MTENTSKKSAISYFLIFIYFFSGFAALVYQVVWQRWLAFFTGISSVNISLIVSAFMAGLGLGYLVGGFVADKLARGKHVFYFFLAEMGIGFFACFSKGIFYDWMLDYAGHNPMASFSLYGLLFLVLLIPTFLMGVSLPLLSKAFRNVGNQGNFIGLLYFTNTLGAAAGTCATSFYLIPRMGFEQAVNFAAFINFFCGISVLIFGFSQKKLVSEVSHLDQQGGTSTDADCVDNVPFKYWLIQYFISGFTAISFEIIWFRLIDVMMKSYAVTFSIILAIYLGSMAIGTWLGVIYNTRFQTSKLKVFLIAQTILYAYVALSIVILYFSIENFAFLQPLRSYFEGYDELDTFRIKLVTRIVIPIF